jgi:lipopolysaccharide transport system permease protein
MSLTKQISPRTTLEQVQESFYAWWLRFRRFTKSKVFVLLIILLGLFLRVYDLGTESLSVDEGTSVHLATSSIPQIIENRSQNNNPPLHFIMLYCWVQLFGQSEYAIRFLSVICGLLAIVMIYKVTDLLFEKSTGLFSAILLSISLFHIRYSQEARGYSLMVLLALISMYLFIRLLGCRNIPTLLVGYILSSSLLMYTHFFGLFIVVVQNVYFGGINLFSNEKRTLSLMRWIFVQSILAILYIPWIKVLLRQIIVIQEGYWVPSPTLRSIYETLLEYSSESTPLLLYYLVLILVSIFAHKRNVNNTINPRLLCKPYRYLWGPSLPKNPQFYLLLWLFIPIILPYAISLFSTPIYYTRYTIVASIAFYILIAKGLRNINNLYLGAFVIVSIVLYSLSGISEYYSEVTKQPWRELADYIDSHAQPDDLLLLNPGGIGSNAFAYYFERDDLIQKPLDLDIDLVTEETQLYNRASIDDIQTTIEDYNRAWLVSFQTDGTNRSLIQDKLSEHPYLSEHHIYKGIDLYFFEKYTNNIESPPSSQLVELEFRYHIPKASEVVLVWGTNGWNVVPEEMRPAGTVLQEAVMYTPMAREGDIFVVRMRVSSSAMIDYGFLITKTDDGTPVEVWDGNGDQDYHTVASQDAILEVEATVVLVQEKISCNPFTSLLLLAGLGIALGIGALFVLRRDGALNFRNWLRSQRLTYLRDLLREMVVRDMKLRYKRSVLGAAWSLLNPLAQLLVFSFLFRRVLPLEIPNYSTFVFCGVLAWNWFQTALILATGAITDNRELIKRPGFPTIILPVVTVTTNLIHFLLALPILLFFILLGGGKLTGVVLALPLVILLQFLLTLSLGYLIATFHVTFRDTQYLLGVFLMLLFYLTPVFYDASIIPARYQAIYRLNPMLHLIDAYRAILIHGMPPDFTTLAILGVLGIGLLGIGYTVFERASYRFVEEL